MRKTEAHKQGTVLRHRTTGTVGIVMNSMKRVDISYVMWNCPTLEYARYIENSGQWQAEPVNMLVYGPELEVIS